MAAAPGGDAADGWAGAARLLDALQAEFAGQADSFARDLFPACHQPVVALIELEAMLHLSTGVGQRDQAERVTPQPVELRTSDAAERST